jgi:vacuolar protein sorting-associated protein IST1
MSFVSGFLNFFWPSFDKDQTKVLLKSALIRLKLRKNKREEAITRQKAEISKFVKEGKDELARIRVEQIIKDTDVNEACDLLAIFIEKLQMRIELIDISGGCPEDMLECVHTIIYASPLISEITELTKITEQLSLKYGQDVVRDIILKGSPFVNAQVQHKLAVRTPEAFLVQQYLVSLGVPSSDMPEFSTPPSSPNHFTGGGGVQNSETPSHHHHHHATQQPHNGFPPQVPQFPSPPQTPQPNNLPTPQFPSPPQTPGTPLHPGAPYTAPYSPPPHQFSFPDAPPNMKPETGNTMTPEDKTAMDLDDLTARFEALKKRTSKQ